MVLTRRSPCLNFPVLRSQAGTSTSDCCWYSTVNILGRILWVLPLQRTPLVLNENHCEDGAWLLRIWIYTSNTCLYLSGDFRKCQISGSTSICWGRVSTESQKRPLESNPSSNSYVYYLTFWAPKVSRIGEDDIKFYPKQLQWGRSDRVLLKTSVTQCNPEHSKQQEQNTAFHKDGFLFCQRRKHHKYPLPILPSTFAE